MTIFKVVFIIYFHFRTDSNMRLESFISGSDISNQCSALTRHCDNANICGTGTCAYSDQSNYICHCEGTGFGGDRCDRCKLLSAMFPDQFKTS